MVDQNKDISDELDLVDSTFAGAKTKVQARADAQQKIIDDLTAQLAAGQPGLTPQQGDALLLRLKGEQAAIQSFADAIPSTTTGQTPTSVTNPDGSVTTTNPDGTTTTTQPGETPVPAAGTVGQGT
jgi:hypothetical protein